MISKVNKGFQFLLCFINIYSKYAWVIPLKDNKRIKISNAFEKLLHESNHKADKIWIDKGNEFYNWTTKSILENNDIEMYSAHNKGKYVAAERFIRTSENKFTNRWLQCQKMFILIK